MMILFIINYYYFTYTATTNAKKKRRKVYINVILMLIEPLLDPIEHGRIKKSVWIDLYIYDKIYMPMQLKRQKKTK